MQNNHLASEGVSEKPKQSRSNFNSITMKKKNLKLDELAVKSFVTNQKKTESETVKGGRSQVVCPESVDFFGPCDTRYCTNEAIAC